MWIFCPSRGEVKYHLGLLVTGVILWVLLMAAVMAFANVRPAHAAGPEIAYDGQSLGSQPPVVQRMFLGQFGPLAPAQWVIQHAMELFNQSYWGYGWGGSSIGPFVYQRGPRLGGFNVQMLVKAQLYGPYTVQSYQFTLPSTTSLYGGASGDPCETRVEPNLDYNRVVIRLGRMVNDACDRFYSYPHLRPGATGERVPVPHPTRPNEYPKVGVFTQGSLWKIYVDDGSMDLVFEVWSGQHKPTVTVRIPQGFGLEAKLPCDTCKDKVTFVIFWNDTQGWHYRWNMSTNEALQESGPMWSMWRMNFLTLHTDGAVEFEELPFLLNPIH